MLLIRPNLANSADRQSLDSGKNSPRNRPRLSISINFINSECNQEQRLCFCLSWSSRWFLCVGLITWNRISTYPHPHSYPWQMASHEYIQIAWLHSSLVNSGLVKIFSLFLQIIEIESWVTCKNNSHFTHTDTTISQSGLTLSAI